MNGPELNAPAVSVASIAAGAMAFLSYVPAVFGGVSSIIGSFLAYYLLKNQMLKNKREKLEISKLEKEMLEDS